MLRVVLALARLAGRLVAIVESLGGAAAGPAISAVTPPSGWPGSLLTIDGSGFGPELDDNLVHVGGVLALVVRATPTRLTVLVGEQATGGPVSVAVAGTIATWAGSFTLRPRPGPHDVAQAGAPAFFHGPQHGTPALRKLNQGVLVILAHAAGQAPANPSSEMFEEIKTFEQAQRFWREASYNRTTFGLQALPWIDLPAPRNEYVWDHADVAAARRSLLGATKRRTEIVGTRGYVAHLGLGLSVVDLTNFMQPTELSRVGAWIAHDVVVRGSRAYVAADTSGLVVLDVSVSPPAILAAVALGSRLRACDVAGTTLVAAALDGGIEVYDVSNPAAPVRVAVVGTGDGWASAVKVVGTRAYVGAGPSLQVLDISNPSAPFVLGQAGAGEWIMGLDVAGTTCVVATDGNGLAVFDVAGATPSPRGTERTVLRLHGVRLAGTIAYTAAGDSGLHVVDVATPTAPKSLAVVGTSRPCHDAAVDGARLVLGVGGRTIVPGNVSTPGTPQLGAGVDMGATFPFGLEIDLGAVRTNLANARNSVGKNKSDRIFVDALNRARARFPGLDLNAYHGFIVVIHGAPGRGRSFLSDRVEFNGASVVFNETKGLIWLASHTDGARTTWGRKAHELGHWFGMGDIYTQWFDDGTYLKGDAEFWDMAGHHDSGALFSGHEASRMRLYEPANVVTRTWNPGAGPTTERFEIVAHGTAEDAVPGPGRVHLVQLQVGGGLAYWIEAREKPGTYIFDASIPVAAGAVLVTRVTQEQSISNTFERPTMLFAVLDVGQSAADAVRLLRIEVEARLGTGPLAYRVAVHWNEEPPPDPDGKFDLTITPWSTETWETPDIWVNSPRNDAATVVYESHEPGDVTRPVLNGDRPWVKRVNTVFARIHNTGIQAVDDVHVTAYITSPPGIGDNGTWRTLASKRIASVPAGGHVVESFEWIPETDKHTCMSVAIMPKFGEIQPRNNRAQENVARFDSPGASSHLPVVLEAEVRSPFSEWRRVDLRVRGLPDGWHAVVDQAWVWVGPKGTAPVTAVIWTDADSPRAERRDIVREAFPRVEGWTDFDHRYLPIGGILAPIRANRRGTLRFEALRVPGGIRAVGGLVPGVAAVPTVVEITDAVGAATLTPAMTDASGAFTVTVAVQPGRYAVQAFTASTREVAEAESPVRIVIVPA
jgi:hypothetical protein